MEPSQFPNLIPKSTLSKILIKSLHSYDFSGKPSLVIVPGVLGPTTLFKLLLDTGQWILNIIRKLSYTLILPLVYHKTIGIFVIFFFFICWSLSSNVNNSHSSPFSININASLVRNVYLILLQFLFIILTHTTIDITIPTGANY